MIGPFSRSVVRMSAVMAMASSGVGAEAATLTARNKPLPPVPPDDEQRSDANNELVDVALSEMDRQFPPEAEASQNRERERVTVSERRRPEYDEQPVRLGSFKLFPKTTATATFDSNVPRGRASDPDVLVDLGAAARLESDWGRHSLTAAFNASQRLHARFSNDDFLRLSATAGGRLDVTRRTAVSAGLRAAREQEDRGSAGVVTVTRTPTRYDVFGATLAASHRAGRMDASLAASFERSNFHDNLTPGGTPVNLQARDADRKTLTASVGFAIKPRTGAFVSVTYDRIDYRLVPVAISRNSAGFEFLAGLRGEVTSLVRGKVAVGLITRNYADPRLKGTRNLAFDAQLDWLVTERDTVSVRAIRDVANSGNLLAPVEIRSSYRLSAEHELLRNLILGAQVELRRSSFPGIGPRDSQKSAALTARWMLSPRLEMNGRLDARKRIAGSNLNGFDYSVVRVSAGLTFRI